MSGTVPDVLVLDDGELHGVRRALDALGVEFVHRMGRELEPGVKAGSALARRLLIATWKYAIQVTVPDGSDTGPIRVCVHHQDFLPMRRRMREMGVDYLVHTHLGGETLQLLLTQLLHQGGERRAHGRLPLGLEATYRVGSEVHKGTLLELSETVARVRVRHELPVGTELELYLPAELNQAGGPPISCRVAPSRPPSGDSPILLLELLEPATDATQPVAEILSGNRLGTRVTRLREAPHPVARPRPAPRTLRSSASEATARETTPAHGSSPSTEAPDSEASRTLRERRLNPRGEYEEAIQALEPETTGVILGHDLSIEGMHVAPLAGLELGAALTLTLQQGERREPLLVHAEVAREDGDRGLWLRFTELDPSQTQELEELICRLPPILLLTDVVEERVPVVVSRWRGR